MTHLIANLLNEDHFVAFPIRLSFRRNPKGLISVMPETLDRR